VFVVADNFSRRFLVRSSAHEARVGLGGVRVACKGDEAAPIVGSASGSAADAALAAVNKDAKAGPAPAAFTAEPGHESLRAAFAKLTTAGLDADAANSSELIAIGSGPGERTTSGAVFARGWNAGWKGKSTVTSSIARVAPSGTTGWVAANVDLSKGTYKIPFHVFAVFDKASNGEWTLVQIQFSV
jgi:hypothetical protein